MVTNAGLLQFFREEKVHEIIVDEFIRVRNNLF
jgi:preprotein translocase subunit Sec61beta